MEPRRDKPELLAPAGTPDAFRAALAAGADAIYCALGNDFNARRSADNFTPETFAAACREAHLAGTRVYVTVNVVIKEREMGQALGLARQAWLLGADALIIQDWGLLATIRRLWPEVECHVSTQANVHDARAVAWCGELGATRVTLSRELSLPELAACAATGVECEAFAHGAICFCYSGLCLMSSFFGGRSANRGLCAQPCRLPYELLDEEGEPLQTVGERLLCPRDMCTVDAVGELADAGICSLKLEGRMKAPDYVHAVVRAYRSALDETVGDGSHLSQRQPGTGLGPAMGTDLGDAGRHRLLKRAFNRDFTDAYLRGRSGNEMMSYERSNNRGEVVGEVVSSRALPDRVTFKQRSEGHGRTRHFTQASIDVLLGAPVGEGDLLEVRPTSDPTQFFTARAEADAAAGDTITVTGPRVAEAGSVVRVIRSQAAFDEVDRALSRAVARRRPVRVRVRCHLGEPLEVSLECVDGSASVTARGPVVEAARTRALVEADLAEHVCRMGATAFEPASCEVELDEGCGMGFSTVHAVRAEACALLEKAILAPWDGRTLPAPALPGHADQRAAATSSPELCVLVASPDAARAAVAAGADVVYATADDLAEDHSAWPADVVPVLDEVCREADHVRLDALVAPGARVAVGNVSSLVLARERGAAAELRETIPVHNAACLEALAKAGARGAWLSPELTLAEACSLARASSVPVGVWAYGRVRLMTSEHCVLQSLGRCRGDCRSCPERARSLALRNIDGHVLPVRTDVHGRSRIWGAAPVDAIPEVAQLMEAGVSRLGVDATLLDADECAAQVARLLAAMEAAARGERGPRRERGATTGHLFAEIG